MKKLYLFKTIILLCALIAGSMSGWADTVTFDATKDVTNETHTTYTTDVTTFNCDDGSVWKAVGFQETKNTDLGIGKGGANYLETPLLSGNISKVEVTWSGNANYYLALQTTTGTELEAKSNVSAGTTATFTVSGEYTQLRLVGRRSSGTSNALAKISKVVVTYTPSGGGGSTTYSVTYDDNGATSGEVPEDNNEYEEGDDVTVLGNTGSLAKTGYSFGGWNTQDDGEGTTYIAGNTFSISANTTLYAKWNAYTITAQSNNNTFGTVSLNGYVITASPATGYTYAEPAYSVSPANSATVSQNGDEFTVTPSANTTVTINFEALPTYTVTLSDDTENPLTEASAGAGVTLPSRSNVGDYTFAGWSETNVTTETTEAPTIIAAGSYHPTGNVTLYPVYTRTESSASAPSAFSVGDTGNYAIVSEQDGDYYALPTNPTVSNGKITAEEISVSESNGVKYITTANASNFTWTIAAATNGYTLSDGSHFIYHSNGGASGTNLTYGDGTTYTWSFVADGNYVTMKGMNGSTINNRGLLFSGTTIGGYSLTNANTDGYYKVMILPIATGTTYYWSNPVAAAVETPVITVAKNPFQISTTATITCETAGAAIKYSFDGENWSDYSEALTITSTTTIYAKAEKDGDVSAIASVTATKELVETAVFIYDTDITNDAVNINNGEAGSLLAIVAAYNADEEDYDEIDGKTATWSSDHEDIATIHPRTGEVTLTGTGKVTFTATYAGDDYYEGSTATYTLTVVNRYYVTLPEDDDYGTYEMNVENPVANGEEVTLTYTPAPGYENYQATWSVNGTPISGNKFTMPNEAVIVTVAVADYATLPFNWEGGARSDLTSITGVTANGLGDDYASSNSPYLVKFDGTGDYILIKTDSQPGKVTIGVKMIGGGDTSFITVQGSSDGTNFTDVETLTISGSLNHVLSLETSNSFAATDRYVRLLFTKGSNVGVGPITIAIPSAGPVINASNVELACDATSGEIAYSISNPVQGVSLSADSNDSWITNVTVDAENSKVTFGTTANTGNERSGSITLSYTGADNKVVTVTQARYTVNATYTLITSVDDITPGKHYVIASSNEDGDAKVMGAQSSTDNNRVAVSGATIATINNEKVLTVSNEYEFVFYGPDANGNYTICDANTNGYLYAPTVSGNLLRTQVTNDANGKWRIELDDERNDGTMIITSQVESKLENVMKYNSSSSIFSCYVANKEAPVYLYEKNNDDQAVATTVSVTLNAYGYATFASTSALDFLDADAAGYSAWQIYDISGETIDFRQINNHVEPGTGILLKGTANGTAKVNLLPAGGKELDYNKLEGITSAKTIAGGEYYGLSGNQFVPVNAGTVPAGKALLPASALGNNPSRQLTFVFEGTQGISTVEHTAMSTDDAIYSISGQRVSTPKKGLYIVNGKKTLVK